MKEALHSLLQKHATEHAKIQSSLAFYMTFFWPQNPTTNVGSSWTWQTSKWKLQNPSDFFPFKRASGKLHYDFSDYLGSCSYQRSRKSLRFYHQVGNSAHGIHSHGERNETSLCGRSAKVGE